MARDLAFITTRGARARGSAAAPGPFYHLAKRALDVAVSALALLALSPLLALIAIAIKLDSPGPAIFRQKRVGVARGRDGRPVLTHFTFYKFRSMYHAASPELHRRYVQAFIRDDQTGMAEVQLQARQAAGRHAHARPATDEEGARKLVHDPRVTRVGAFLRRTSLDELPQLWNVLKGDMSLVGPRPAIPYEVEVYADWHRRRLTVKPGVTGAWQVSARSSASFDEMARLDLWYVDHRSLRLDLAILLRTPLAVLSRRGAM